MTHNEETQKHLSAIEDAKLFFETEIAKREAEVERIEAIESDDERPEVDPENIVAELHLEIAYLNAIRIDLSNAEVSIGSAFELA